MDKNSLRAYLLELLGTFALVYFASGIVCVNAMTLPREQLPGAPGPIHWQQPGMLGVAIAQGVVWGVMVALTFPISGGCLNPAITIMLWVFNRLSSARAAWFIGAQLVGGVLAGLCLTRTFEAEVLQIARAGTPHLNPLVFGEIVHRGSLLAGTGVEFVLTFFVVLGMFGLTREAGRERWVGLVGGLMLLGGAIFAFPLTGAAANPARWFGTVLWEFGFRQGITSPVGDIFVYIAGPILGALLAGAAAFKLLPTPQADTWLSAPRVTEEAKTSPIKKK